MNFCLFSYMLLNVDLISCDEMVIAEVFVFW